MRFHTILISDIQLAPQSLWKAGIRKKYIISFSKKRKDKDFLKTKPENNPESLPSTCLPAAGCVNSSLDTDGSHKGRSVCSTCLPATKRVNSNADKGENHKGCSTYPTESVKGVNQLETPIGLDSTQKLALIKIGKSVQT